jgi:hypothetical protein
MGRSKRQLSKLLSAQRNETDPSQSIHDGIHGGIHRPCRDLPRRARMVPLNDRAVRGMMARPEGFEPPTL